MLSDLRKIIGGLVHGFRSKHALRKVLRRDSDPAQLNAWEQSLSKPTDFYLNCVRFFHSPAFPSELKRHRSYFQRNQRGFGEDAFHVMWWDIFRKLRPSHFLEIGVYRGQTLSLAALLQRMFSIEGSTTGISPFSSAGDSVSLYNTRIDYLQDTKANFRAFDLPPPNLLKAFSTDSKSIDLIRSRQWDAIYIDGNHDYGVAKADWILCKGNVRRGGILVLDDASLGTSYLPPQFATAGHPGPSKLVTEIDPNAFREILQVGHNRVFQKL